MIRRLYKFITYTKLFKYQTIEGNNNVILQQEQQGLVNVIKIKGNNNIIIVTASKSTEYKPVEKDSTNSTQSDVQKR